jgi:hypothetical protein
MAGVVNNYVQELLELKRKTSGLIIGKLREFQRMTFHFMSDREPFR